MFSSSSASLPTDKINDIVKIMSRSSVQAAGYATQLTWCVFQARINWESCDRNGIWHKNDGDVGGRGIDSLDRVASSRIVDASASVIFSCTKKPRRWHVSLRRCLRMSG